MTISKLICTPLMYWFPVSRLTVSGEVDINCKKYHFDKKELLFFRSTKLPNYNRQATDLGTIPFERSSTFNNYQIRGTAQRFKITVSQIICVVYLLPNQMVFSKLAVAMLLILEDRRWVKTFPIPSYWVLHANKNHNTVSKICGLCSFFSKNEWGLTLS